MEAFDENELAALKRLQILDTAPEPVFDEVVFMAADICDKPTAILSFLDETRQWFKARVGLDVCETPRSHSFCHFTVRQSGVLEVPDASRDERFMNNPYVTGPPGIRFYAGAPIKLSTGESVGAICVVDYKPGTLSKKQKEALQLLSNRMVSLLELRLKFISDGVSSNWWKAENI